MDKVTAASSSGNEASPLLKADASSGEKEMGEAGLDLSTSEKVFAKIMNLLAEIGFRNLSIERSEDFTERIDGVFTRRTGIGNAGSSGYLRILTVYRSGERIHAELYNFLRKFPADGIEMSEVKQVLTKLFGKNKQVKMDIHE